MINQKLYDEQTVTQTIRSCLSQDVLDKVKSYEDRNTHYLISDAFQDDGSIRNDVYPLLSWRDQETWISQKDTLEYLQNYAKNFLSETQKQLEVSYSPAHSVIKDGFASPFSDDLVHRLVSATTFVFADPKYTERPYDSLEVDFRLKLNASLIYYWTLNHLAIELDFDNVQGMYAFTDPTTNMQYLGTTPKLFPSSSGDLLDAAEHP